MTNRNTDFWIKEDNTSPNIEAQLLDDNDDPVDLSNASVRFHMAQPGADSAAVDASASITDAANGKVEYDWSSGDTDTAGEYYAEWEVTFSSGDVETFPNDGYLEVLVDHALV